MRPAECARWQGASSRRNRGGGRWGGRFSQMNPNTRIVVLCLRQHTFSQHSLPYSHLFLHIYTKCMAAQLEPIIIFVVYSVCLFGMSWRSLGVRAYAREDDLRRHLVCLARPLPSSLPNPLCFPIAHVASVLRGTFCSHADSSQRFECLCKHNLCADI